MRLREQMAWWDPPEWYGVLNRSVGAAMTGSASMTGSAASTPVDGSPRFLSYNASLASLATVRPRLQTRGAIPLHHFRLMHAQLRRLRSALFVARLLGRALILPPMLCGCELGFWIGHVGKDCRADGHRAALQMPYICPIDHYLFPRTLAESAFTHRERTFLDNPRTPQSLKDDTVTVQLCRGARCAEDRTRRTASGTRLLRRGAGETELVTTLASAPERILHFEDIEHALGHFDSEARSAQYHSEAQSLLSSWCCTSHAAFKSAGGEVPYLLPPLPARAGERAWRGEKRLDAAAQVLVQMYTEAGDALIAEELRPCPADQRAPNHGLCSTPSETKSAA